MPLTELWLTSRSQLEDKHVQQIITFAGDGHLLDGSAAAQEFREFLTHLPAKRLQKFAEQCLVDKFKDSGLALQDVVNEMGRRLGFKVFNGRYRGSSRDIGYDGLWSLPQGHSIIVEVKTTDAFRIDLNVLAQYRRELIEVAEIDEDNSSILLVVGRQDTGDLEAQIRGSTYAWNIRLISIDALVRLMTLKEEVEDQNTIHRIYEILIPREFTKLDAIVDILFSTAEEVKYGETEQLPELDDEVGSETSSKASFTEGCVAKVERHLRQTIVKRSRVFYSSPDDTVLLVCLVSKVHSRARQRRCWFAFRSTHRSFLAQSENSYVVLGCGSEEITLLIPLADFENWLEEMHVTDIDGRIYWHVGINLSNSQLLLQRKKGAKRISLVRYIIPN